MDKHTLIDLIKRFWYEHIHDRRDPAKRCMRQHGFIQLPLMTWAAIAAGVVILSLGAALKIQSERLATCKQAVEVQNALIQGLGNQIKQQNAKIGEWELAAKNAKSKGAAATKKAEEKAKTFKSEADRLSGLLQNLTGASRTCQAAVKDAKTGLQQ